MNTIQKLSALVVGVVVMVGIGLVPDRSAATTEDGQRKASKKKSTNKVVEQEDEPMQGCVCEHGFDVCVDGVYAGSDRLDTCAYAFKSCVETSCVPTTDAQREQCDARTERVYQSYIKASARVLQAKREECEAIPAKARKTCALAYKWMKSDHRMAKRNVFKDGREEICGG